MKKTLGLLAMVLGAAIAAPPLRAQESGDCLECHADRTLETRRDGQAVSLHVDAGKISASIHGSLSCTGCHADLSGTEYPHPVPAGKVQSIEVTRSPNWRWA